MRGSNAAGGMAELNWKPSKAAPDSSQRLYSEEQADLAEFPEHAGALHESRSSRPNLFPCRATPVVGSCRARQRPLPYFYDGPACANNPPIFGCAAMRR